MQYLEDFEPGQRFVTRSRSIPEKEAVAFARQFDPQPFHLDAEAAKDSTFGQLTASGWHTAALTMRMLVDSDFSPANGIIGFRIEELAWSRPVIPGDQLHVVIEVVEVIPSRSKPDRGVLRVRFTTVNRNDEAVQEMTANLLVIRRPTG
jgi:acyl dehydratase